MTAAVLPLPHPASSPFAGADICAQAGLTLPPGASRPNFDDDLWDFSDVAGLPVVLGLNKRRFSFAQITDPRWRLTAKELIFAMLVPRHEAVAELPRAYRLPAHIATASGRLDETAQLLNWLTGQGVSSLAAVGAHHCEAYLAHRRYLPGEHGAVAGERSPSIRRRAAQAIIDLLSYGELFTTDRPDPGLRPWGGATASAVAEMPSRGMNKTPPLSDDVLRPLLAAAIYLTTVIGPHAVTLNKQVRESSRQHGRSGGDGDLTHRSRAPVAEITRLLEHYVRESEPLPMLPGRWVAERLAAGWQPDDPLLPVALNALARQAGLAYRPGGVLAAKVQLKHVAVATTEGYPAPAAPRPSCSPR